MRKTHEGSCANGHPVVVSGAHSVPRQPTDAPLLFIPLKREHFEAFERGEKWYEYRRFGKRWNAKVCRVGRPVVLSLGYGMSRRLGADDRAAMKALYGSLDFEIAVIGLSVIGPRIVRKSQRQGLA